MKKIISGLIGLAILALPVVTLAAIPATLDEAIARIVDPLFLVLVAMSAVFIIYAAYTFVTSGGDPTKAESARTTLIYAIIGIIVAFLARALYTVLKGI